MKAELEERRRKAGMELPPKPPKGAWVATPDRRADPLKSGLTGEVKTPASTIDCALEK